MKKQILALSLFALTSMPASAAINCAVLPTCDELGYRDTVDNCMVKSYALKCPFDQTKGKCQDSGPFIGEIRMMAGNFIPNGWMICDGRALDEATYSALYSVIGENYSTYNNMYSTKKFNIPDLRSRVPVGVGQGSGLTQYSFGASGGEEKHTLTISEMPSHNHSIKFRTEKWGDNANRRPFPDTTGDNDYGPKTTEYTGGSQAHENRMPYVAVQYIIYTGVVQ